MDETKIEGTVKSGAGKLEGKVGEAVGSDDLQARGAAMQVKGQTQKVLGVSQETVDKAADAVKSAASQAGEQARDIYDQAQERVRTLRETVDPFVQRRPYPALGIALLAGLVLGRLLAGRGPRVIYVKPRS